VSKQRRKTLEDGRRARCPAYYGRKIAFKGTEGWHRGTLVNFESWGFLGLLITYQDIHGRLKSDFGNNFSVIGTKDGEDSILLTLPILYQRGILNEPTGIDFKKKLKERNVNIKKGYEAERGNIS
jgi:hypothetical protein